MDETSKLRCMTCGQEPASWLVAYGYSGPAGPGRILHYCESDMRQHISSLSFVLPLNTVLNDPDRWMALIYESGLSKSAPEMVAGNLGLDVRSQWVVNAQLLIDQDR